MTNSDIIFYLIMGIIFLCGIGAWATRPRGERTDNRSTSTKTQELFKQIQERRAFLRDMEDSISGATPGAMQARECLKLASISLKFAEEKLYRQDFIDCTWWMRYFEQHITNAKACLETGAQLAACSDC